MSATAPSRQSRSWRSQWSLNLLLASGATMLSVISVEIGLVVSGQFAPYPSPYYGERVAVRNEFTDSLIGWKLKPYQSTRVESEEYAILVEANGLGFRDPREFTVKRDERRVIFLGDSFTFGNGVELESTFAKRSVPSGVRSFNFGMSGFGIDQMWMSLHHYGWPLAPDIVVLAFIENDLTRSLSAYRWRGEWRWKPAFALRNGRLVPQTAENRPSGIRRWVQRHSRLAEAWGQVMRRLNRRYAIGYRWRLNRALFEAIRDECLEAGIPLLAVYIPSRDNWEPLPMLHIEFADMGIPFFDLAELLPAHPDSLYFEIDRHWNNAGHAFAAEALSRAMVALAPSLLAPVEPHGAFP